MGAWTFVKPRFENMCGRKVVWDIHLLFINDMIVIVSQIKYYGRSEGGTVAVGVSLWHKAEAADVVKGPFTLS